METLHLKLLKQLELSWNNLDIDYIKSFLLKDVVYESQWVFSSIKGKSLILKYLQGKFDTIKKEMANGDSINARIGYLPSMNMRPCIVLSQKISEKFIQLTILIEVRNSLISRIDLCFIPDPSEVIFMEEN